MVLKYTEVADCPLCGKKGRLAMQISGRIADTITQGRFIGSGVGTWDGKRYRIWLLAIVY